MISFPFVGLSVHCQTCSSPTLLTFASFFLGIRNFWCEPLNMRMYGNHFGLLYSPRTWDWTQIGECTLDIQNWHLIWLNTTSSYFIWYYREVFVNLIKIYLHILLDSPQTRITSPHHLYTWPLVGRPNVTFGILPSRQKLPNNNIDLSYYAVWVVMRVFWQIILYK